MKNVLKYLGVAMLAITFGSCTKDPIYEHYTFYRPVYQTKAEVKSNIKSNSPTTIENAGKIFVKGSYVFLNDIDKGIHIIDYSNPVMPRNIAFINIPGCRDIAVKDNYMYADCFTDLVTVDISNPGQVNLKSFINGVFPNRYPYFGNDTGKVIVDWVRVDTAIKKGATGGGWPELYSGGGLTNSPSASAGNGTGGSMAAFALMGNRMYTVDNANLKVFNTSNGANPQYVTNIALGSWQIETIYPFNDKLFIGSQNGMMIYSASSPDNPSFLGSFAHATMCDPVIADGDKAYVTLRSGNTCTGTNNQLDVLNITNVTSPQLIKTYPLNNPAGLAKDGNKLLICDDDAGLKLFNAAVATDIYPTATLSGIKAYDVIAMNGIAIVSAKEGIYFVDYATPNQLNIKGKINVQQ